MTAPLCKSHIKKAGFRFLGHTEYLCDAFEVKDFAMMLFHSRLRVILSTVHIPLKRVAKNLNEKINYSKTEFNQ